MSKLNKALERDVCLRHTKKKKKTVKAVIKASLNNSPFSDQEIPPLTCPSLLPISVRTRDLLSEENDPVIFWTQGYQVQMVTFYCKWKNLQSKKSLHMKS